MKKVSYQVGELVMVVHGEWKGYAGVVSWPITEENAGYVLVYIDGSIAGLQITSEEIKPADESYQGFTQLTYHLLKLSSYVIERSILINIKPIS
jgi:hypothetical protein